MGCARLLRIVWVWVCCCISFTNERYHPLNHYYSKPQRIDSIQCSFSPTFRIRRLTLSRSPCPSTLRAEAWQVCPSSIAHTSGSPRAPAPLSTKPVRYAIIVQSTADRLAVRLSPSPAHVVRNKSHHQSQPLNPPKRLGTVSAAKYKILLQCLSASCATTKVPKSSASFCPNGNGNTKLKLLKQLQRAHPLLARMSLQTRGHFYARVTSFLHRVLAFARMALEESTELLRSWHGFTVCNTRDRLRLSWHHWTLSTDV